MISPDYFTSEKARGSANLCSGNAAIRAFTLLEMVGVLGIFCLLALALVPVLLRRVDLAAVNSEAATLRRLGEAILTQVQRSNSIPSEGAWVTAAGNWVGLPTSSILTNARNRARAFLVDPGGWLASLPTSGYYFQSADGTVITNSARLMLVSSLSADLPVSTGLRDSATFNAIWNTPPGTVPPTWTSWSGRGEDLLIQRLNLQPLFSQLILVHRDPGDIAAYVIAGQTRSLSGGLISNAYYLKGTVVSLGSSASGSVVLQTSFVLNENCSYVFEAGTWNGQIGNRSDLASPNPGSAIALSFKNAQEAFLLADDSPNNANAGGAAGDQEQVLAAMSDFMLIYSLWSGENFRQHGMSNGQAKNHLSLYNYLENAQTRLSQTAGTTRNITTPPYYSGLLY